MPQAGPCQADLHRDSRAKLSCPEASMKITCESCSAQYDLDDSRIPSSGLTMKCPACLHSFTVRKGAAAPPPPPASLSDGIALSDLSDLTEDESDLLARVKRGDAVVALPALKPEEGVDLPAPRAPRPPVPPKNPPPPLPIEDDLPALRSQDIIDLP